LAAELNAVTPGSAVTWIADLDQNIPAPPFASSMAGIVANASTYAASSLESIGSSLERDLNAHLFGHLALIDHCKSSLIANRGAIVAVTDIHVERPSKGYLAYHIAKGALDSAVRALAIELAPYVRVNAVAPGPLDWPTSPPLSDERIERILQTTPLARNGTFAELAAAVDFLMFDATYTTGSTLKVDGGRSFFLE